MFIEGWFILNNSLVAYNEELDQLFVPDDIRNRHRAQVAEWEAQGNTIPVRGAAALYHDIDFSNATLSGTSLVAPGGTYSVQVTNGGINPSIVSLAGSSGWGRFGALAQTPAGNTFDRSEATLVNHAINFGEVRHVGIQVYLPYDNPLYPLPNNPVPRWNYILQFPQGDLPSGLPIALGIRVSGNRAILELRRGHTNEPLGNVREWSIPLDGEEEENYFNRTFHILVSFKLHATHGFLRAQVRRPWDGANIISPIYEGPLGFTGGDDKCSVKFGLYRGAQDASPGQNANPGAFVGFKKIKMTNTLPFAKTWD